jgi:hypothetical protein
MRQRKKQIPLRLLLDPNVRSNFACTLSRQISRRDVRMTYPIHHIIGRDVLKCAFAG